jgi:Holliday junction resolvasome RuvABC endonuclease subunit
MSNNKQPVVLWLDPGFSFGYAILKGKKKLVRSGLVTPYRKVVVGKPLSVTIRYIMRLIRKYKPSVVLCERFMFRGGGSMYAEVINHVIGALVYACAKKGVNLRLVQASHWKHYATKLYGYDNSAKSKKRLMANPAYKMYPGLDSVHTLDAAMMARFALDQGYHDPKLEAKIQADKKRKPAKAKTKRKRK